MINIDWAEYFASNPVLTEEEKRKLDQEAATDFLATPKQPETVVEEEPVEETTVKEPPVVEEVEKKIPAQEPTEQPDEEFDPYKNIYEKDVSLWDHVKAGHKETRARFGINRGFTSLDKLNELAQDIDNFKADPSSPEAKYAKSQISMYLSKDAPFFPDRSNTWSDFDTKNYLLKNLPPYAFDSDFDFANATTDQLVEHITDKNLNQLSENAITVAKARNEVPHSENVMKFMREPDFDKSFELFLDSPLDIITEVGSRSASASLHALATGVAGLPAGPAGFVIGTGVGSGIVENAASIMEGLEAAGVDLTDESSIAEFLSDDVAVADLYRFAKTRAAIIGSVDAATGGLLLKTFAPGTKMIKKAFPNANIGKKVAQAENAIIQTGIQVTGGGTGELLAQAATQDDLIWGEIWAETFAELITTPIDVAVVGSYMYLDSKNKTNAYFDNSGRIRFTNGKVPKGNTPLTRNEDGTYNVDSMPSGTVVTDKKGNPFIFIPDSEVNESDQKNPGEEGEVIDGEAVTVDQDTKELPAPDIDTDTDTDVTVDTDITTDTDADTDTDVTPETTTEEKVTTKRFKINEGDYPITKLTIGNDVRYYQKEEDVGFGARGPVYWIRVDENGNRVNAETGELLDKEDTRGYSAADTNQQSLTKIKQEMLDNYKETERKKLLTEQQRQFEDLKERRATGTDASLALENYPYQPTLVDVGMRLILLRDYTDLKNVDVKSYFEVEGKLKEKNIEELETYIETKLAQVKKANPDDLFFIKGIEERYLELKETNSENRQPRQKFLGTLFSEMPEQKTEAKETPKQIADRNKIADIIDESEKGLDIEPMSRSSSAPPGVNYVPLLRGIPQVFDPTAPGSRTTEVGQGLKNPINRTKILRPLLKALDIPLFQGSINNAIRASKSTMGYWRRGTDIIRIRYTNDLEVVAHEIAHLIDYRYPEIAKFYRKNNFPKEMDLLINEAVTRALEAYGSKKTDANLNQDQEVEIVTPIAKKDQTSPKSEIIGVSYTTSPSLRLKEGFAEFHRLYMTQPEKAKELTPNIYAWYEGWLDRNPVPGKAIKKASAEMQEWYNQDVVSQFRSKIGDEGSVNNYFWKQPATNIRMAFIDDLQGIKSLTLKQGNYVDYKTGEKAFADPYEIARLTRGVPGIIEGALIRGVPTYVKKSRKVKGPDGKEKIIITKSIKFIGKPLDQILAKAQKNKKIPGNHLQLFYDYMYAVSSMELQEQGRQYRFTVPEMEGIIKIVEENHPQMKEAFKEYLVFQKGILKFTVDGGLISPKEISKWKRSLYVPLYNVGTAGPIVSRKRLDNGKVNIRRLFGSTENLLPAGENIIGNIRMMITETLINEAKVEIIKSVKRTGKFQGIEPLIKQVKSVSVSKQQINRFVANVVEEALEQDILTTEYDNFGEALTDLMEDNYPEFIKFLSFGNAVTGGDVIQVMENGKAKEYQIADANLYKSLQMLKRSPLGTMESIFSGVRRVGQNTITLMPKFLANSLWRETFGAWVFSYHGQKPFLNTMGGLMSIMRNDPMYQEFLANGGGYSSYIDGDLSMKRRLYKMTPTSKFHRIITSPMDAYLAVERFANMVELATKVSEFKEGVKQGVEPRLATFRGRETGADFAMQGTSEVFNYYARSVMFLQATLTGLDRTYRGLFKESNRASVAAKAGILAVVGGGILLHNMLHYRDEYDDLEDWEEAAYITLFYTNPITGKVERLSLPKMYDLGIIMNVGEGMVKNLLSVIESGKSAGDAAYDFAVESLTTLWDATFGALPTTPQILKGPFEQALNLDTYTRAPIETLGQQQLNPAIRTSPGGSPALEALTQNFIGTKLDSKENIGNYILSPVRIEKFIKQYFNTAGEYAIRLLDEAYLSFNPEDRKPQKPILETIFSDYIQPVGEQKFSSDITDFYNLLGEAQTLHKSAKAAAGINNPDGLNRYAQKFQDLGFDETVTGIDGEKKTAYAMLVNGNKEMTEIGKRINLITYADPKEFPIERKEEIIKELLQQRIELTDYIVTEYESALRLKEAREAKKKSN